MEPAGRPDEPETHRSQARARQAVSVVLAFVVAGVLATACGAGSASPGIASVGSTTTTVAPSAPAGNSGGPPSAGQTKQMLAFVTCMRSHGVSNFPDPLSTGGFSRRAMNAVDQNSPQFRASLKSCRSLAIATGFVHTPVELAKHLEQLTAEDECIRRHGVRNWPDPNAQGGQSFPPGISPSTPRFQKAQAACAYLNP